VKLDLPERVVFSTEIPIRISDVNYGGHVGNDAFLALAHEARLRFLQHFGYGEQDIEGRGIIMSDAAIVYRSESFYGDVLRVDIGIGSFTQIGCDILYAFWNKQSGKEVARLKTGIVFFDYASRKPVPVPKRFQDLFINPSAPPSCEV